MKLPQFMRRFSGQGNVSLNTKCSEFEVNKSVISRFVVQDLVPIVGFSPFPLDELMLMAGTVCRFKPTHIFEWGTHVGASARVFYQTSRRFGIGAEIHSIDLPDEVYHAEHPGHRRGRLVRGIRDVRLHQGDGLTKSIEIYRACGGNGRPLFFLDGDHAYESVTRELDGILKQVENPIFLLHDTLYQSGESGYNVGPFQAVTDTLPALEGRFNLITLNMGLPGMMLLYPKGAPFF